MFVRQSLVLRVRDMTKGQKFSQSVILSIARGRNGQTGILKNYNDEVIRKENMGRVGIPQHL